MRSGAGCGTRAAGQGGPGRAGRTAPAPRFDGLPQGIAAVPSRAGAEGCGGLCAGGGPQPGCPGSLNSNQTRRGGSRPAGGSAPGRRGAGGRRSPHPPGRGTPRCARGAGGEGGGFGCCRRPSGVSHPGGGERRVRGSAGMWPFVVRLWPSHGWLLKLRRSCRAPAQPRGARVGGSPPPLCPRAPAQGRVARTLLSAAETKVPVLPGWAHGRAGAGAPRSVVTPRQRGPSRLPCPGSRSRGSPEPRGAGPAAAARCHPRTGHGSAPAPAPAPPARAFPRKPGPAAP